jgi:hypothetical protein
MTASTRSTVHPLFPRESSGTLSETPDEFAGNAKYSADPIMLGASSFQLSLIEEVYT